MAALTIALLVQQPSFLDIYHRYEKGEPAVRLACVADFASIADDSEQAAQWLRAIALKDPSVTVREAAVRALGPRIAGSRDDLEALLWVVLGNGHGRHGGCPIMREMVSDGGDLPTLRGVVGEVLRRHPNDEATEILGMILLEKNRREQIVVGLTRNEEPGMTELRRALAAELLGEIGSDRAVELLKEASDGDRRLLRLAAVRALGHTRRADVLPYLLARIDTELKRRDDWDDVDTELREEMSDAVARLDPERRGSPDRALEIVFIFDSTNHQAGKFDEIKRDIERIIRDKETERSRVRVALMAFRDLNQAYLTKNVALTTRLDEVIEQLREMRAGGGKVHDSALARPYENAVERLNWSRDSDKRIYIYGDETVDHPDSLYMQVSDMAVYERARTHVFYTVNKETVRVFMERLARLGDGICDYLPSDEEREAEFKKEE